MHTITAPAGAAVAGLDAPGGHTYDDAGTFTTDDAGVNAYCRDAGYGVDGPAPDVEVAEPVDPRHVGDGQVGTALRDAATDPEPTDYLPPTNAGEANPHGPLVVAPGIHAEGTQVIRPGIVAADPAEQQAAETRLATAILVERQDVGEATAAEVDRSDSQGELGLSDPGSVGAEGDAADDGPFDPTAHTLPEVQAYLKTADDAERDRVLAAEREGKARAGVLG